jgi:hypothetical protein
MVKRSNDHAMLARLRAFMGRAASVAVEDIATEINAIIKPLKDIGWEYGPHPDEPEHDVFSFSCGADGAQLQTLKRRLGLPIRGKNWTIGVGIPPRDWERYFEIIRDNGRHAKVEANCWSWRPGATAKRMTIDLAIPASLRLNEALLNEAIGIFLTGELGELNRATLVERGSVVRFRARPPAGYLPISSLRASFVERFPKAEFAGFLGRTLRR